MFSRRRDDECDRKPRKTQSTTTHVTHTKSDDLYHPSSTNLFENVRQKGNILTIFTQLIYNKQKQNNRSGGHAQ